MSDHWTRVGAKKSQRRTKEADAEQNQCCVIDSKEPRVPCQKLGSRPLSPALGVQSKWDWAGSPEAPPAPEAAPAASPCPHHSPGSSPRPLCTSSPLLPGPVHPCPLFIYWAGGGVRAQAERRFPVSWDKGSGHSNCGLFPFPWLGVDLIKRETHDLLALFRGRDKGEVN